MSGNGSKRDVDELLISALASGKTRLDAATLAGVSDRTAYRRLTDTAFRQRVTQARAEVAGQIAGRLVTVGVSAVEYLVDLAENARSEAVRLGAARAALELALRWRQADDLERRIARLEGLLDDGVSAYRAAPGR